MTISLHRSATVLFQGDSITDVGRLSERDSPLGNGLRPDGGRPCAVRARPDSGITFLNRGVSGDRVADLRARWREDAVDLEPDVVSVLIGVNDTWRRYDSGDVTSLRVVRGRLPRRPHPGPGRAGRPADPHRALPRPGHGRAVGLARGPRPQDPGGPPAGRGVRRRTAGRGRAAQPGGARTPEGPSTSRGTGSTRPRSGTPCWRRHGRHWSDCSGCGAGVRSRRNPSGDGNPGPDRLAGRVGRDQPQELLSASMMRRPRPRSRESSARRSTGTSGLGIVHRADQRPVLAREAEPRRGAGQWAGR